MIRKQRLNRLDRLMGRSPMSIRGVAENCIRLGELDRAEEVLRVYHSTLQRRRADVLQRLVSVYSVSNDPVTDIQRYFSVSRIDAAILVRMLTLLTEEIHTMCEHLPMCR